MQSNGDSVVHKQKSTPRVAKHWQDNKKKGYKRKLFWISPNAEFKLKEYAKRRGKPSTWILDDLMKNVF